MPHLFSLNGSTNEILKFCCQEYKSRLEFLQQTGFKNFIEYNDNLKKYDCSVLHKTLPYIVIIGEDLDDYDEDFSEFADVLKHGERVGICVILSFKSPKSKSFKEIWNKCFLRFIFAMEKDDSIALLGTEVASCLLPEGDCIMMNEEKTRMQCALVTKQEFLKLNQAWQEKEAQ